MTLALVELNIIILLWRRGSDVCVCITEVWGVAGLLGAIHIVASGKTRMNGLEATLPSSIQIMESVYCLEAPTLE